MTVYDSQIDWWLPLLLCLGPIILLVLGLLKKKTSCIILSGLSFVLSIILLYPCRYTFHENHLNIRCGITHNSDVQYSSMRSVERSRDSRSAPALSLDRIKIMLSKGSVVVSPTRPEDFIKELTGKIQPNKSVENNATN